MEPEFVFNVKFNLFQSNHGLNWLNHGSQLCFVFVLFFPSFLSSFVYFSSYISISCYVLCSTLNIMVSSRYQVILYLQYFNLSQKEKVNKKSNRKIKGSSILKYFFPTVYTRMQYSFWQVKSTSPYWHPAMTMNCAYFQSVGTIQS